MTRNRLWVFSKSRWMCDTLCRETFLGTCRRTEKGFSVQDDIPGLRGAHSQGATLDELQRNLHEVIELIVEERAAKGNDLQSG